MIEAYFAQVENVLRDFPTIRSYTLTKKVYSLTQGYISGMIVFEDGSRLEFVEVKDTELIGKVKYRYQYMDEGHGLIFRYDNAPQRRCDVSAPQTYPGRGPGKP